MYQEIHAQHPNKIITVYTKVDEHQAPFVLISRLRSRVNVVPLMVRRTRRVHLEPSKHQNDVIHLSSKTKHNIDTLINGIEQKIATLFAQIESPFLLNQRQHTLLLALELKLAEISVLLAHQPVAYELLSIHLNDAVAHLAELSGKRISEAGMDMVFREFCVGK